MCHVQTVTYDVICLRRVTEYIVQNILQIGSKTAFVAARKMVCY